MILTETLNKYLLAFIFLQCSLINSPITQIFCTNGELNMIITIFKVAVADEHEKPFYQQCGQVVSIRLYRIVTHNLLELKVVSPAKLT